MGDIASLLFPFFGLILIGFGAAKATRQSSEALGWLNTFIIYAALPALFFKLVSSTPIDQLVRFDFIGLTIFSTYLIFVVLFALSYWWRKNSLGESIIQSFAGSYGNIGYMGPGLALLALGEKAAAPVALIVCLENAVHFTVAPASMALRGEEKRSWLEIIRDVLWKVFTHPFILSVIAGFAVAAMEFSPPKAVAQLIDYLAQAAAPCALFVMGVTLALRPVKRIPTEIYYIVPAKLIIHPILTFTVLSTYGGFDPIWVYSATLLAGLPTATNVFVIGQQYNVWQERASATVLIATALSVVTLSVVLYSLRQL